MSLDVYLQSNDVQKVTGGIFIREDGQIKELTRAEWDDRYPDREPLVIEESGSREFYWRNITHNLNKMADAAGIYECLWRPDELGIKIAHELIEPLSAGLEILKSDPDRFKQFNPSNGWGTYEGLVDFVEDYLNACREHPSAIVHVSR